MSAFLGPIHFWLYNKIQLQQELVEEILKLSLEVIPGLREDLDTKYDVMKEGPLEEIVDGGNIHGWLQYYVSSVEYKLAYSVTALLKMDSNLMQKLETIFWEKGKEKSNLMVDNNAAHAYKVISDSLLDGMPCDNANRVMEENENKVLWIRNTCVHKKYWDEVEGNVDIYYLLRDEFIKGALMETELEYEKVDEVTSLIRKRGYHE